MAPRRRRSAVVAPFSVLAVVVIAACGGAVDNSDLFKKGSTTTSSGGTPTATATATSTPPSLPTSSPPVPDPQPAPACQVSFATDVMQVFDQAGCADLQCHGGKLNEPAMDSTSPSLTYKSLTAFTMSTGEPYVALGTTVPKASGIFCNLRGNCGVRMPLGDKLTSKELTIIDSWLACGAPFN